MNNLPILIPSEEELLEGDRDYLEKKYIRYYNERRREYEKEIAALGKMPQMNRAIPEKEFMLISSALEKQHFITAKTEDNQHQYCLWKKWVGDFSFDNVVQIMRKYGYVEWFWRRPYMMFNIGDFKYWTMGNLLEITTLINRKPLHDCTRQYLLNL